MFVFSLTILSTNAQRVTININNVTLKTAMAQLKKQTGYSFVFKNGVITNLEKRVTVNEKNEPIRQVVDQILSGQDVEYEIQNRSVVVFKKKEAQRTNEGQGKNERKTIKGTVLDANGEPMIGVSVKGRDNTGTITDIDGNFSLNAYEGEALSFSYLGYTTKRVLVGKDQKLNVVLSENATELTGVVVTALGIKREEKALGYSTQQVNSKDLTIVKSSDVATALTGKIAGLDINNSSEISEKPTLTLRGENPLIVVDGVAFKNMSLSELSAEDIESIDVLKGATASALYGERGQSGAIMVTTKKGDSNGTVTVNVSNNTMFSAGFLRMPNVQSSYSTGNYGQLEYGSGYVWGDYMDGHEVDQYDPITMTMKKMPLVSKGKNNVKNFLRSSIVTNTNVNISQSGKLGGYRVSATQVHMDSQYPNSSLDKYIINGIGNISYKKFKLVSSLSYKKEKTPNLPKVDYGMGNILYNMLIWGGTEYDIRDFKQYWKVKDRSENWGFSDWYDNPYYIANERIEKQDYDLLTASANLSYEFSKDIKVMFRSGYDNYCVNDIQRRSIGDATEKRGFYFYQDNRGSSFNNDLMATYKFNFKGITIDGLFGGSIYWYHTSLIGSQTRGGLSVPGFYSLVASAERPDTWKTETEKALYSAYGKMSLSWKDGIYVDATGRNDWSSTLPSSSRSYFYPSVSASFLPTTFYNPIKGVLDFWKLRGSWTVSKQDLGVYENNLNYTVSTDSWNGYSSATYPNNLRDPNCKPQKETSVEIGTNLRLFKNRLNIDYTYFTRLRSDRLTYASVSHASGSSSILTNYNEEIRQKGMELTVSGKPIITKDFTWQTAVNWSYWHWYYGNLDPNYSSKDPRLAKGERCDKYFITDWEYDNDGNMVLQAGLPKRSTVATVIGHSDPKFYFGWTNTFTYKGFQLQLSFDGHVGGLMYSWTEQAMWHSGVNPGSDNQWRYDEVVNHKTNYIAKGVKVVSGSITYDPYGKTISDTRKFAPNDVAVSYQNFIQVYNNNPWDLECRQNIRNSTFIKLRELAINYTLPKQLAQKVLMKDVRLGFVGQNLFMLTSGFKYSDPDRGRENLNTPTCRYLGFNINLTF